MNTLHGRRENGPAALDSVSTSGRQASATATDSLSAQNIKLHCRANLEPEQNSAGAGACIVKVTSEHHLLVEGWGSMTDMPLRSLRQSV